MYQAKDLVQKGLNIINDMRILNCIWLTIIKEILKGTGGGGVSAENSPGAGAVFSILLHKLSM